MKDNLCNVKYYCKVNEAEKCVYFKDSGLNDINEPPCFFYDNIRCVCTSAVAKTNRLVLEFERITGIKIKETINL